MDIFSYILVKSLDQKTFDQKHFKTSDYALTNNILSGLVRLGVGEKLLDNLTY